MVPAFPDIKYSQVNSAYAQNTMGTKGKGLHALLLLCTLPEHFMYKSAVVCCCDFSSILSSAFPSK